MISKFNDLNVRLMELGAKGEIVKIDTEKSADLMEPVQKESKLLNKIKHKRVEASYNS